MAGRTVGGMTSDNMLATVRLENRALQTLLVVSVGVLSWLLVAMFDRLEEDIDDLGQAMTALQDESVRRDSKLAELVLQIEHRITVLEENDD
jgi:hypothetical protein